MFNIIKRKDPKLNPKRAFSATAFHLLAIALWWGSVISRHDTVFHPAHIIAFIAAVVAVDLAGGQARRAGRHAWMMIPAIVAWAGAATWLGGAIVLLLRGEGTFWTYVQMALLGALAAIQGVMHYYGRPDQTETLASP